MVFFLVSRGYALMYVKAIECALPEQQTSFIKELDPHVHRCVRDANGNHVINARCFNYNSLTISIGDTKTY